MEATHSHKLNVAILDEQLQRETWYNTFWSKFAGFVDINDDNGNQKKTPSGKPIEVMSQFIEQGRDNMLTPFLEDIDVTPVYGDTVLKGTGVDKTLRYLRTYVNQWRGAVNAKSGTMSNQRVKMYDLIEKSKPLLARWNSKNENAMVSQAFYEGASLNLTTGTADDGIGLSRRYHPNLYINDGAALTAAGVEFTTKTNAQMDSAATAADTSMTCDILMEFRLKMLELKIPQIVSAKGFKFWALLVHPQQMNELLADTQFTQYNAGHPINNEIQGGASPMLTGCLGYYAGFAIFEDIIAVRSWDATNLFAGGDGWLEPDDTGSDYCAIAFGNSAIAKGIADPLHFTYEEDDHKNVLEVGSAVVNGYNRADFATSALESTIFSSGNAASSDVAATLLQNTSSAILMTN